MHIHGIYRTKNKYNPCCLCLQNALFLIGNEKYMVMKKLTNTTLLEDLPGRAPEPDPDPEPEPDPDPKPGT